MLDSHSSMAVKAWNIMQGIDWDALPIVFEMLGIKDPELIIRYLFVIKDFNERKHNAIRN